MKTIIIAEAGVNHNGDLKVAEKLIDAAYEAGADYVKFQTFKAEDIATASTIKAEYQLEGDGDSETQYSMLKRFELSDDMHDILVKHSKKRGIKFLSSAFDINGLHFLNNLGLDLFKIPSGEITNLPYLRVVGGFGKPIILSTGMATTDEIRDALFILQTAGACIDSISVLHCTTQYPTPMCNVNLHAMLTVRDVFGVRIGYSDHTRGIEVPIAAVALGASIIEKHFTLDRSMVGPDHSASLEPDELAEMISSIRNIELALGSNLKIPTSEELKNKLVARKSIVAKQLIKEGELFSESNLTIKRPGSGISPMHWDSIIGKSAIRQFLPDEIIEI
jgi:N,N'-diacetyllegionaminate synthase